MKRTSVVSLFVLWVLPLWAINACAQTPNRSALTVKIPFEFVVGNQTFPAGTYKFRSLLNSVLSKASIDVLEVRSTLGRQYSATVTDVVDGPELSHPQLVFTRTGGQAFLSEVWEAGKPAGCRLQRPRSQTPTAKGETDKVTLVASADWH